MKYNSEEYLLSCAKCRGKGFYVGLLSPNTPCDCWKLAHNNSAEKKTGASKKGKKKS